MPIGSYSGTVRITPNTGSAVQVGVNFLVSAPAISSPTIGFITPSTVTASPASQALTIAGSDFQSGLMVALAAPNGSQSTVSGSQIMSESSISLQMQVVLNAAGLWNIRVNNPDGGQSN